MDIARSAVDDPHFQRNPCVLLRQVKDGRETSRELLNLRRKLPHLDRGHPASHRVSLANAGSDGAETGEVDDGIHFVA
jgi:hypothetical protein